LWLRARRWREFPNGALVFPSITLRFAWRSLQNYFSLVGVFALIGDEAVVHGASGLRRGPATSWPGRAS
jgi:hypothetical protein